MITREELERQLALKSPGWWDNVQRLKGKENYYYDSSCKFGLVTIDRHAGTTPMYLSCKNPDGCTGVMRSMGYPDPSGKPAWLGEPTHEWYRPDRIDDDADDGESDHLMNGGLLLREVTGDD